MCKLGRIIIVKEGRKRRGWCISSGWKVLVKEYRRPTCRRNNNKGKVCRRLSLSPKVKEVSSRVVGCTNPSSSNPCSRARARVSR
jgi:hypothetical protein